MLQNYNWVFVCSVIGFLFVLIGLWEHARDVFNKYKSHQTKEKERIPSLNEESFVAPSHQTLNTEELEAAAMSVLCDNLLLSNDSGSEVLIRRSDLLNAQTIVFTTTTGGRSEIAITTMYGTVVTIPFRGRRSGMRLYRKICRLVGFKKI